MAELLGESVQIERCVCGELLLRAGGFDAQELGVASQRVERDNTVRAANCEIRVYRLIPAQRFAGLGGGQLGGGDRAGDCLAVGAWLQAADDVDRAGGDCRVAANSQCVRQHRGQFGDVDRSAEFKIMAAGGDIRIEPTANGGLAQVAAQLQVFDHETGWLRRELPGQLDSRESDSVSGESRSGCVEAIDRQ